jgi:AGCS family alanine or glycine:cation symporter
MTAIGRPWLSALLKVGLLTSVVYGCIKSAGVAWDLGDLGVGVMAWLNLVAIVILQKPALIALRDYERQKNLGIDPCFDPLKLGIRNATFWETKAEAAAADGKATRDGKTAHVAPAGIDALQR